MGILLKKFFKRLFSLCLKNENIYTLLKLIRSFFASEILKATVGIIISTLAGLFTCYIVDGVLTFNWPFIIIAGLSYLAFLILSAVASKSKNKYSKDNKLIETVNNKLYEILVVEEKCLRKYRNCGLQENDPPFDMIAENVCTIVHNIITNYYKSKKIKVTIIKRIINNPDCIELCASHGDYAGSPKKYKITEQLSKRQKKKDYSYHDVFKYNNDEPVVLKNETEVKDKFSKGKTKIDTKQYIGLPGIIEGEVVLLLQISSYSLDVFSKQDFEKITNIITPQFIQVLCNIYEIEKQYFNGEV